MKFLKYLIFANFCFFLTACVNTSSQKISSKRDSQPFKLPQEIIFEGEHYVPVKHSQINEMQNIVYLLKLEKQNLKNWQKALFIFLDENTQNKTLQQRLNLREIIFKQQPKIIAKLQIINNELQGKIIYPPTQREQNVQLSISRGRNLECGFAEIQYAEKRLDFMKNLQKQIIQKEVKQNAQKLSKLDWIISCKE